MIDKMDWADIGSSINSLNIKHFAFLVRTSNYKDFLFIILWHSILGWLFLSDFEKFNTIFSLIKYQFFSCVVLISTLL